MILLVRPLLRRFPSSPCRPHQNPRLARLILLVRPLLRLFPSSPCCPHQNPRLAKLALSCLLFSKIAISSFSEFSLPPFRTLIAPPRLEFVLPRTLLPQNQLLLSVLVLPLCSAVPSVVVAIERSPLPKHVPPYLSGRRPLYLRNNSPRFPPRHEFATLPPLSYPKSVCVQCTKTLPNNSPKR